MTVSDGLPTYEPVAGGETQLSEFPAAPQRSGPLANAFDEPEPPDEELRCDRHLVIASAIFLVGFFVPPVWLLGIFLWDSPNYTAKMMSRLSVVMATSIAIVVIAFAVIYGVAFLLIFGFIWLFLADSF